MQRRDILDRLPAEERQLVASFWDKAERAAFQGRVEFTGFLDPGQRALLWDHRHLWQAGMVSFGGYETAERQIVAAVDNEEWLTAAGHEEETSRRLDWPLVAIQVEGNFRFAQVSHRDYLGSLLALGLKRELFGDILVLPDGCQLVLHEYALPFVLANWASVGPVGISVRQIELSELRPPQREQTVRTATVAALRLDAVVGAAYGLSRSKAADLIRAGKVKLNHRPELRPDRQVTEGAMLSLAGQGRAELLSAGGSSRSGRVFIKVGRWR